MDDSSTASIQVVVDLLADSVEVDVDEGVGRVVEKQLDGLDAGYFLFWEFLCGVDEEWGAFFDNVLSGSAVDTLKDMYFLVTYWKYQYSVF